MILPEEKLMKKVYWVNRYFKRLDKLFEITHRKWLDESIKNYGSTNHQKLTILKNKMHWKMNVLARYSSLLTSKALIQCQIILHKRFIT